MSTEPATENGKPTIAVLHTLARSGGSLFSRCLGCMDSVVLLSEIHPAGLKLYNPLDQADKWFNLFTPTMAKLLKRTQMNFVEAISLIDELCEAQGKNLIVRDWAHLDFTPAPFHKNPSYELTVANVLQQAFNVKQLCLVRHPVPQWQSLSKLGIYHGGIEKHMTLEQYLHGYRRYAEKAKDIGFIKYENFTEDPENQMQAACKALGCEYDAAFITKWPEYTHYTGDINDRKTIQPVSDDFAIDDDTRQRLENNPDYCESITILGYA